jgi:hypothetical protein
VYAAVIRRLPRFHEEETAVSLPVSLRADCGGLPRMRQTTEISPAKRKRLLKTFGPCPAGYTTRELEQVLDLIYGMFSHAYTQAEIRQMVISNPFDHSIPPRQVKLVDFTDWLEALVS